MAETEITTKLTNENIQGAANAIKTYITTCTDSLQKIQKEIDNLRTSGFIGDASDGYNSFLTTTINNLNTSFYNGDEALFPALEKWLNTYLEKLLSDVDVNLKSQNENIYNGNK